MLGKKTSMTLAGTALAALLLSSCGENGDAASAEAEDDGTAETAVEEDAAATLQASSEGTPEYDVWHGGTVDAFISAMENDLLAPHESEHRADLDDVVVDDAGYGSGIYVGALGFRSKQQILDELGVGAPRVVGGLAGSSTGR